MAGVKRTKKDILDKCELGVGRDFGKPVLQSTLKGL